ncbi:hypothetical protein TNCV_965801 [Trichonephila clavipes]|nr:hypothetical protein TNCV_965801 [Trichonephila clavipes]
MLGYDIPLSSTIRLRRSDSDLEEIEDRDLKECSDFTDDESISDSESLFVILLEATPLTMKALKMATKDLMGSLRLKKK